MEISPIKDTLHIALVGDYSPDIVAHQATPLAIDDAAVVLGLVADYDRLTTSDINSGEDLIGYDAIWVVPGSPYRHLEGALIVIRYVREDGIPFLGTCGGSQYAILEYARNVLGWGGTGHVETDTTGRIVIALLICPLVEKADDIELRANTLIAEAHGRGVITEGYHCNYGVPEDFAAELESGDLRVTGWGEVDDTCVIELVTHLFYVGMLFQHECGALAEKPVLLVQVMLRAVRG